MSAPLPPTPPGNEPHQDDPARLQKQRTGLNRIIHAAGFSVSGLKQGWQETAFRQEAVAALVLVPLAFWRGFGRG